MNEPMPSTRDDIISLADFIPDNDKELITPKMGRPTRI